jgi:hypothetical protein
MWTAPREGGDPKLNEPLLEKVSAELERLAEQRKR